MIRSTHTLFGSEMDDLLWMSTDILDQTVAQKIMHAIRETSGITATINFHHKLTDIVKSAGIDQDDPLFTQVCTWLKNIELISYPDADAKSAIYWYTEWKWSLDEWRTEHNKRITAESEVTLLRAQCESLQEQVTIADSIIAQSEETAEQFKHYDELKAAFSELFADKSALNEEYQLLDTKYCAMCVEQDRLQDVNNDYALSIITLQNQRDQLLDRLSASSDRLDNQQEVICAQEDRIRQLEKLVADLLIKQSV